MNCKYLYGSKMLKLSNNRDDDWLVFDDVSAKVAREAGCMSIPLYRAMLEHFIRGNRIKPDYYNGCYLYQLSAGFRDDPEYLFKDFNISEYKEVWKQWLKAYANAEKTEAWAIKSDILPKQFYHLLYQYYMIVEDTHWISDNAKAVVQKIHDLEMPSSYFYELRDLINNL